MKFNKVFVILLHLVVLTEIVTGERNSEDPTQLSWEQQSSVQLPSGTDVSTNPPVTEDRNREIPKQLSWEQQSSVKLPSGTNVYLTNPPVTSNWECGDQPTLTTLKLTKQTRKEYIMVRTALKKRRIPGGINKFRGRIIKIEKIENPCLWNKYIYRKKEIELEAQTANEHLLFHGSPAIPDIVVNGFDERHASINGWFGAGLYFASHSAKSHGFTVARPDKTRLMLLCRVAMGNIFVDTLGTKHAHAPRGYHSVKGDVGMPEYIVYRGEQAYPEYLITYK